jgi:S1-C subfamily serine protease
MRKVKLFLCAILIAGMASRTLLVGEDKPSIPASVVLKVEGKNYPSLPEFLLHGTTRIKASGGKKDDGVGFGSAFAVDLSEYGIMGRNYVITAAHVVLTPKGTVADNLEVEVVIPEHNTRAWVSATVVCVDKDMDMAILAVDVDVIGQAKIAQKDDMNVGDAIAIVGCPSGTFPTVTFGFLASKEFEIYAERQGDLLWQGSATIYPGNSGGPVFNPNTGEIIGIAVAGLDSHGFAAHVDFFVPMTVMRNVIAGNLEKFKKFEHPKK